MDVIHAAIWVSDLDDARAFFVDALDLEENWSFTLDGIENVYVGGDHGEIQLRYDPDREDPDPTGRDWTTLQSRSRTSTRRPNASSRKLAATSSTDR